MVTTPDRVRIMGKEFTALTDEQLNLYIEDASLEVSSLNVSEEQKERLTRYLAAHLASINIKKVVKEKVDVIERTYSAGSDSSGFQATPHGQEFERLLLLLTKPKKTLNLTVL